MSSPIRRVGAMNHRLFSVRAAILVAISLGAVACSASGPTPGPGESNGPGSSPGTAASPPSAGTNPPSGGGTSEDTAPPPPSALNPNWSARSCPAAIASVGFEVDKPIGDLGVTDCDTGAPASIDELCGASATWIFAAHTHCPTCQATASFTDEVAKAVESKNVAIVQVVYSDNGTSCAKWRAAYKLAGLSNVKVYADATGAVFDKLKVTNSTAPSAFLDKHRVMTFRQHGMSQAEVLMQIDAALAKP